MGVFFNAKPTEANYVGRLIKKFKNINELNLSAFGREGNLAILLDNEEFRNELADAFKVLNNLKRLRLNVPGCKYRLEFLLSGLKQPLEYINLTSCGLVDSDLRFLINSIHVTTIQNLVLSNNDLSHDFTSIINLLKKCAGTLEVLDLGCNSFDYATYVKIFDEGIANIQSLKMLITLDVFTFDNYLKIADRLSGFKNFLSWRINYSADYYEHSVRLKNKFKFRKFKNDYIRTLENKFDPSLDKNHKVKITINDPDLNYILNEIL